MAKKQKQNEPPSTVVTSQTVTLTELGIRQAISDYVQKEHGLNVPPADVEFCYEYDDENDDMVTDVSASATVPVMVATPGQRTPR